MRPLLFVVVCVGLFVGCSGEKKKELTDGQRRAQYFELGEYAEKGMKDDDYLVVDHDHIVVFSSAPLIPTNDAKFREQTCFREFKRVMAAVDAWIKAHPDTKFSIAVSERGGHYNSAGHSYNTVRVVLLKE